MAPLKVALRGQSVLADPALNKGSAFTEKEREAFGLIGLLPVQYDTLDKQIERAYGQYQSIKADLEKNTFLQSLRAQNWVLFYALINAHLEEMFPIIYTPTEADAIANYSHVFRRPEGLYLCPKHEDSIESSFLAACGGRELDLIVVSDGEAILGIGDQGSGAIGISSAKGAIYTLVAGIDPRKVLPVVLDVGTNNEDLLKDELYLGWPEKRLSGDRYMAFAKKFVDLVKKYQPQCLLHFEDFGVSNAQTLLDTYRDQHAVFNDDIQGTGAVTLAALQAGLGVTKTKLSEQRIVAFGAGSAGLGIARQIRDAAVLQDGVSKEDAAKMFFLVDKHGLLKQGIKDKIRDGIDDSFIRPDQDSDEIGTWPEGEVDLLEVVKRAKPTVIIGTSTKKGAFSEDVCREMAKHTDRPIIMPLSNPTRLCEVQPQDALNWTDGKALLATGSPFPAADLPGSDEKYQVAECNNALVYPGLGLGAIASRASKVTDKMIVTAAKALGELSPALKDPKKALLPDFADSQSVNFEIALAVIDQAVDEGVSKLDVPKEKRREWLKQAIWKPEYPEYEYDKDGLQ
ncbi:hypothetical protein IAU60_002531 [Kwoniella sp. DSM 27419]